MGNRNIRILSHEARSVMVDLMCMMMEGDPYGSLNIDGTVYDSGILSKILIIPEPQLASIMRELVEVGKDIQIDPNGLIYSRHMMKNMEITKTRMRIGAMGGNPALKGLPHSVKIVEPPAPEIDPDKYIAGSDPVSEKVTVIKKPESEKAGEYYLTKKGRKLNGTQLKAFDIFWNEFNYKHGRAAAADTWLDLKVTEQMFLKDIIPGARREAARRPSIEEKRNTPIYPQGWLSERRWEDGK